MKINYEKLNGGINKLDADGFPISIGFEQPSTKRYLTEIIGYNQVYLRYAEVFISLEKLNKNFKLIDTNNVRVKKNKFIKGGNFYTYNDKFVIEIQETDNDSYVKIVALFYHINEDVVKILDFLNTIVVKYKPNKSSVKLIIQEMDGLIFPEFEIKYLPIDINSMYNDDFENIHDKIINNLTNKNKGLIMLYGSSGTGKTNYIKYLTTIIDKTFIFVPSNMIHHITSPSFIGYLKDMENIVLILEDADDYIKSRTLGINSDVVSSLLNLSDGILSDILGIQIIITFNTGINNIDEALLRKGRLLLKYEFEKLKKDKCQRLFPELKIERDYSLAELFNMDENEFDKKSIRLGF